MKEPILNKIQHAPYMYYIRKYADCWAIHDDVIGTSRQLTDEEKTKVAIEFSTLQDEKVRTVFSDTCQSIQKTDDHAVSYQRSPKR